MHRKTESTYNTNQQIQDSTDCGEQRAHNEACQSETTVDIFLKTLCHSNYVLCSVVGDSLI